MKKVLHINDYPMGQGGGAEVIMARTVDLLRAAGWEVNVFTCADLPTERLTPRRYIDNPVARRSLAARLAAFRPDVVHLHNFYHLLSPGILAELEAYKRRHPARVVMTAHDYHLVCPNSGGIWYEARAARRRPIDARRVGRWSYLLSRRWDHRGLAYSLLKLAQHLWHYRWRDRRRVLDAIFCPSRFLQGLLDEAGRATIHLPHPAPRWRPRPPEERPGPLRLVFAGRLEPEKGLNEFLEFLPPSFEGALTVVGDGRDAGRCRATCRRRGLEGVVRFLGRRPHAETLDCVGRSHVLVLPSLVLENTPVSTIEALSLGTNLLVSDLGGIKEVVEASGVGHVFTPGDTRSLTEQLAQIVRSHRAGTLNRFDLSDFLRQRDEQAYVRRLLNAYENGAAA